MPRTLLVLAAVAVLAGCSTTAIDVNNAPRAEASAYVDPSLTTKAPNSGQIRIARDSGFLGSAATALIYLDGRHVANSEPNTVLELNVPPGPHQFGLQPWESNRPINYQKIEVTTGQIIDYRIMMPQFGADMEMSRIAN